MERSESEEGKARGRIHVDRFSRVILLVSIAAISFYLRANWTHLRQQYQEVVFWISGETARTPHETGTETQREETWTTICQSDHLFLPTCLSRCATFANETVLQPKSIDLVSQTDLSCHSCPHYKPFDTLFSYLDFLVTRKNATWGHLLDAGTGASSLKWGLRLKGIGEITAVTVSEKMMEETQRKTIYQRGVEGAPKVNFVLGDWNDQELLQGKYFDHILADYLIGAMDGFTPYSQDLIFTRLGQHLKDENSSLFIVGMEPYPETAPTQAGKLLIEVSRLRDACILLHHQRPYREFPLEWIIRTLKQSNFEIVNQKAFPVIYGVQKLLSQLSVCTQKIKQVQDPTLYDLKKSLNRRIDQLTAAIENNNELKTGLCFGMDYVVEARKKE